MKLVSSRIIVISLIHGVLLCIASIFLQRLPWTFQGEDKLIQWSSIVKHIIFHENNIPYKDEFLFVNTSYSNQLIDKFDDVGFPLGNQVITDRMQLAIFTQSLVRLDAHKWAIFDIYFGDESEYDEMLEPEIAAMSRLVMSTTTGDKGERMKTRFNNQTGLANIETLDDIFLKYQLVHSDSLKVVPLEALEGVKGFELEPKGGFVKQDGQWGLNYYIPDLRISQFDLTVTGGYPFVNLSDVIYLDDETILSLVKDRIVIVGDFLANDNLETLTGEISGPLLLANLYLSLLNGEHLLSWQYFLFLSLSFSLISLIVFLPDDQFRLKVKFKKLFIGGGFVAYLAIISIISYVTFNKAMNVFILSFYLIGLNYLIEWNSKRKALPNTEKKLDTKD